MRSGRVDGPSHRSALSGAVARLHLRSVLRTVVAWVLRALAVIGVRQSQAGMERAAQRYWRRTAVNHRSMSHWRGEGGLTDETFALLGRQHVALYERFAAACGHRTEGLSVMEWGCGGGSTLVAFAPLARTLVGVDIDPASLERAAEELRSTTGEGVDFQPVLVDVSTPESAIGVTDPVDLFLCFYVFELLPSPEYGLRLLRMIPELLTPDGAALVQFKYDTGSLRTTSRRMLYRADVASTTTYTIEDFWIACTDAGLTPQLLVLQPEQPVVDDERYAYVYLTRA